MGRGAARRSGGAGGRAAGAHLECALLESADGGQAALLRLLRVERRARHVECDEGRRERLARAAARREDDRGEAGR
eukprot:5745839-Prymnesium_polylepis.1